MKLTFKVYRVLLALAAVNLATPSETSVAGRDATSSKRPIVDLGYAIYQGSFVSTSGLNVWKGCVTIINLNKVVYD